ncbi:hypothetical protein MSM1_03775 [Mycobacterium sp. SM1]|uniref:hypothetical protein n=1 Tax=Mycobacterium sp. SM1 TaxID=2816243 RepID=UPI001BCD8673|nr:hypothetical protein [Mycobacterium sp. SM1]MBS4727511.1 hypothetical protein [Mycobacterium sp. SM1]
MDSERLAAGSGAAMPVSVAGSLTGRLRFADDHGAGRSVRRRGAARRAGATPRYVGQAGHAGN